MDRDGSLSLFLQPRPLSSLDPRVLLDAELRGSAVCLALGRGMRSESFLVPLDVLDI